MPHSTTGSARRSATRSAAALDGAVVGMAGHALRLEHDQRRDAFVEPGVDTRVELTDGNGREPAVREVEQRDARDAERHGGVLELATADPTQIGGRADGARLSLCEAEHRDLAPVRGKPTEDRAESEALVVGVRDHRGDGTVRNRQHAVSPPRPAGRGREGEKSEGASPARYRTAEPGRRRAIPERHLRPSADAHEGRERRETIADDGSGNGLRPVIVPARPAHGGRCPCRGRVPGR